MRLPSAPALTAACLAAALLTGCLFGGDGGDEERDPVLTSASLAETGLIGMFDLVDFKLEFTDGQVIDTSQAKITGLIQVTADSAYTQRIWVSAEPNDTKGRITGIKAEAGDRRKGRLTLTLEGSETTGETGYELRGDTLIWITEVEAVQGKSGFTETGRYVRNPG